MCVYVCICTYTGVNRKHCFAKKLCSKLCIIEFSLGGKVQKEVYSIPKQLYFLKIIGTTNTNTGKQTRKALNCA